MVVPWNKYQLYYRDPATRQFKPITNEDGSRWSVRFKPVRDQDPQPIRFIKWKMQQKFPDHQRYSRKQELEYLDLQKD